MDSEVGAALLLQTEPPSIQKKIPENGYSRLGGPWLGADPRNEQEAH